MALSANRDLSEDRDDIYIGSVPKLVTIKPARSSSAAPRWIMIMDSR